MCGNDNPTSRIENCKERQNVSELLTGHLGMYNHVFVKIRPRLIKGLGSSSMACSEVTWDVWMSRWVFQLPLEATVFSHVLPNGMILAAAEQVKS